MTLFHHHFRTSAAAVTHADLTALVEEATKLESTGQKVVADFHNHSKSPLVEGLVHELEGLQQTATKLKTLAASNRTVTAAELSSLKFDLSYFVSEHTSCWGTLGTLEKNLKTFSLIIL